MIGEKFYEALPDEACCTQNTDAPFFCGTTWQRTFLLLGALLRHICLITISRGV